MIVKERKLTSEERELVEKHHDLIYMIVDCMEEDIDECYDVLAIALCHAAQRYKSNRCYYGRYGFEEYAKVIMLSEYYGDKYRNSY